MTVLFSAVGATDPIRENHDGPLLHLARHLKPDSIVLLYSKEMYERHSDIKQALDSIPNYDPTIVIAQPLLEDVYRFDRTFDQISSIVNDYVNVGDRTILNLSSGTPQIISALFAINRINEMDYEAYQVTTPKKSSNQRQYVFDVEQAISENKDALLDSEKRYLIDEGLKFDHSLVRRQLRDLINQYDYSVALKVIQTTPKALSKSKRSKLVNTLTEFDEAFKFQHLVADIANQPYSEACQKALNSLLMIEIALKKKHLADVLVKSKSLAEFMVEDYIEGTKPGLIDKTTGKPILNPNHDDYDSILEALQEELKERLGENYDPARPYRGDSILNLPAYETIVTKLASDESMRKEISRVLRTNGDRNRVAHGLSRIELVEREIKTAVMALRRLFQMVYSIDEELFSYYEKKNEEMCQLLI